MKVVGSGIRAFNKFIEKKDGGQKKKFDENKLIKLNVNEPTNTNELLDVLNGNGNIIFPSIDKTLPIIFYDFSVWTKFKSLPNNILGRLDTSYKPHKECIYIREKTFTAEPDPSFGTDIKSFNGNESSGEADTKPTSGSKI
ncbi:hypothetical protein I7T11_005102, partial [Salmonella enterica]|nr:hypothetical protein [Salmonella enterica]